MEFWRRFNNLPKKQVSRLIIFFPVPQAKNWLRGEALTGYARRHHMAIENRVLIWKVDYLLTWNCKHIANAHVLRQLRKFSENQGHEFPQVCTPEEL
jgi:hypothetical protein